MKEFINTVCKILWSLYYYEWELIEVKFLTKKPEPNVLLYNLPANEFPKTNTEMDTFIENYQITKLREVDPSKNNSRCLKVENAEELLLICFGQLQDSELTKGSGWQRSACRELYKYFMSIFDPMITSLVMTPPESYIITPDFLMNHFQNCMLAEVRSKCEVENYPCLPIIWKTVPSRRHSCPGEYIVVKDYIIDMPISLNPSALSTPEESQIQILDQTTDIEKRIKDNFFANKYGLKFGGFKTDLRSLIHNLLLLNIFKSHQAHIRGIFTSHGLYSTHRYTEWFHNVTAETNFWGNQVKKLKRAGYRQNMKDVCEHYKFCLSDEEFEHLNTNNRSMKEILLIGYHPSMLDVLLSERDVYRNELMSLIRAGDEECVQQSSNFMTDGWLIGLSNCIVASGRDMNNLELTPERVIFLEQTTDNESWGNTKDTLFWTVNNVLNGKIQRTQRRKDTVMKMVANYYGFVMDPSEHPERTGVGADAGHTDAAGVLLNRSEAEE